MATKEDKKEKELDILLANKEVKVGDKTVVVKRFSLLDTIRIASHLSGIAGMSALSLATIGIYKIIKRRKNK